MTMTRARYKARLWAERAITRKIRGQRDEALETLTRYARERRLLAMLAADTPQFDNPLDALEAQEIRDHILAAHQTPTTQT